MKISIITVCKNSEKTINQTIKSVISQTYKDIEYIIIDGSSTDKTKDIVLSHGDRISKFVSEPDRCLWEAMNKAIRLAAGNYLYFINSDDYIYDQDVINDIVKVITKTPELDFIYGNIKLRSSLIKSYTQISLTLKPPHPSEIIESMILGGSILNYSNFIKSNLFEKIGFYNENYKIASDYEWITKLMNDRTVKLFYFPRVIASFYTGGMSSNFRETHTEQYEVQNNSCIYQTDYWVKKRLETLEKELIEAKVPSEELANYIESTSLGKLLFAIKKGIKLLKN